MFKPLVIIVSLVCMSIAHQIQNIICSSVMAMLSILVTISVAHQSISECVCSFIFLSQVKCPVFLLFWVHVCNVIYSVMIIPVTVFPKEKQVKKICMRILRQRIIPSNNDFIYLNRKSFSMGKVSVSRLNESKSQDISLECSSRHCAHD